ncbi:MAG TPA: hypothetical protein PLS15_11780 [Fimbriimonadaceae bacterium]|nr:hypothetical protein [Fimbriimonadaceae bacterium]HRE94558.1 hypothetical protein [Fimbriimonadaceae bacterium]
MAERRRQEIWNRINRIGVSLHELADEIQALAAELKTEEGEDFAEFSMDDFTRDFAHALQNMAADEESEWSSPSSFSDDDVEEEQPIATEEQNWEPVGEGLAFSQDDLIAALAEVKPEAPEALAEEPVATAAPEEQPVATSVYLAAPENETQSIDDILATLKPSAPEVAAEVATTPVAEVAAAEPEPLADAVMSELDEALNAVNEEVEDTWTEVSADAPLMAQDELAAALSALESGTDEPAAAEPNVISLEEAFAEGEPEPVEDPKVIEEELAFEPAPAKPAAPAPSDGGMILSEDEIAALLAEAQARAEDVDEEPIFNENGEMNETARFMTELRGEAQPEAAPAAASASTPSSTSGINPHAVQKVPASLALSALAMPVEIEGDQIVLHAAVPLDQIGIAMIGQATGLKPKIIEKPLPEVLEQLRQNYQDPHAPVEAAPRLTNIS